MVQVATPSPPRAGQVAPNFALVAGRQADGKPIHLELHEECRKGPLVLAFFPGVFTSTCTQEMCRFSQDWERFSRLGARVVGISVDSFPSQRAFAERHGLKVAFVSDFERRVTREWGLEVDLWWGACSRRATFVLGRDAVVRWAEVLPNADLEPDYAAIERVLSSLRGA